MIEEIVFAINNFDLNKEEEEEEEENNPKIQFKKKRKGEDNDDKNNILNINKNRKSLTTMTTENKIIKKIRKKKRTKTGKYKNKKEKNSNKNNILNINNLIPKNSSINKNITKEKVEKIMEYSKEEKNQLLYEDAIKNDNRTFCEYYISLIQTKHSLIFSFYYHNDYNSRIIKIDLFFNSFILNFAVNALFFNDETMHQIYEEKGKYLF